MPVPETRRRCAVKGLASPGVREGPFTARPGSAVPLPSAAEVGTAVEVDDLAGEVTRAGARQEAHGLGDVFGPAGALGTGMGDEGGTPLVGQLAPEELGVLDQPRRDHVR